MKKWYWILTGVAVYFLVAIGIILWDVTKPPVEELPPKDAVSDNQRPDEGKTVKKLDLLCAFTGETETRDNPWGFTAGLILTEEGEEAIFLTPDTSCTITDLTEGTLELRVGIYPAVRESSDGADLLIRFLDADGGILGEHTVPVPPAEGTMPLTLEIPGGAAAVRLLCGNGGNNDESCDWVIITR